MTSDLARAIAFAYRRKGVDAMPGSDLRMLLAYDLRWFAPEDAKRCVQRAIEAGLLREDGASLAPTFDVRAIDIPLNFRPSAEILDAPLPDAPLPAPAPNRDPQPSAQPLVARPSPSPSAVERAAEEERRKRGLRVSFDVARLIVRRRAGEDVAAEAGELEKRLLTRA